MPAGVADLRQGIILAQVGERDRPLAPARAERCLQPKRAPLHCKPAFLEPTGKQAARALLRHRELRIPVNLARDPDQLFARVRDGCLRRSLGLADERPLRYMRGHGALYSTRAGAIIRHALWNRGSLASMVTPMSSAIQAPSRRRRKRYSRRGWDRLGPCASGLSPTTSVPGATSASPASSD